ncbi:TonB-dependent receptor [Roseococcus pinisoli]|uniref:TonB-dependent receptor n=1 Tax=Roseococcus pinisoli TaxID=2835040 RepID=A0ABS5Q8X0_9PROT|nr:TonB-dependent receptor [Roseococcus pinisoli]MBS7809405.1 TonB-dependent receptor [Roseococcus pinisoli]
MRGLPLALVPCLAAAQEASPVIELDPIEVQSSRLDTARTGIAPSLGASVTRIDRDTIERLPQGGGASLNQVLLQAPGVVQEAQGDLHVRGDHRNLQYRINGVIIPEAISGFGQLFDARGLRAVELVTGALPAQFGYRTAGIVDIGLRSGAQDPGGSASLYGGSFGQFQPSLAYGGAVGPFEYYVTGSYLRSDRGFENPTSAPQAIHNSTEQVRGLVNMAWLLDDRTRLSFIGGTNQSRFQIPNVPGQAPQFTAFGQDSYDSASLRARQWQRSSFGLLAVQHSHGALDVQVSAFMRQTSISYVPDTVGEVILSGVGAETRKRNTSIGLQGDASWRLAEAHTLRAGFFVSGDVTRNIANSTVLPLDAQGATFDAPYTIRERGRIEGQLYGVYAQDEWRITDQLTLNFGGRFDVMNQQVNASQLSPRANLVWRPSDATTVSLGYARYFTPPPSELLTSPALYRYVGTTLAPEVLQASPARPERAHYFNLGLRHRIGENLTLGAEAYYRSVRDMQDLGQFGSAYIFSPYNYREGRVFGTELSAQWRRGALLAYGNLTLSRSEGRGLVSNQYFWSEAELAQVQKKFVRTDHDQLITGSAGVAYNVWEGGNISSTLLYGSGMRRGFANSQVVTPYVTVNLGLSQEFTIAGGGKWTARLDVLNLFDRSYQLRDGTGIGVGAPQYGMRRGIFAGLSRTL